MVLGAPASWAAQAHRAFARLVPHAMLAFARLGIPRDTEFAAKNKHLHRETSMSGPCTT